MKLDRRVTYLAAGALIALLGTSAAQAEAFYAYARDYTGANGQFLLFDADSGETTPVGPGPWPRRLASCGGLRVAKPRKRAFLV